MAEKLEKTYTKKQTNNDHVLYVLEVFHKKDYNEIENTLDISTYILGYIEFLAHKETAERFKEISDDLFSYP